MWSKHIWNQDGSADAQSRLTGAASQPGTSATWQPQRPAGQLSQPRALTCMATAGTYRYSVWTTCELYGATSAPKQYLCTLLTCYGQWSWWRMKHRRHWSPCTGRWQCVQRGTRLLRGLNAHRHPDEAYRPALCGGGREAVSPSALHCKRREPRWRHSARGNEGHRTTAINGETPFRSEVSLALFKIVFCR